MMARWCPEKLSRVILKSDDGLWCKSLHADCHLSNKPSFGAETLLIGHNSNFLTNEKIHSGQPSRWATPGLVRRANRLQSAGLFRPSATDMGT
jgi:hypothetical protein